MLEDSLETKPPQFVPVPTPDTNAVRSPSAPATAEDRSNQPRWYSDQSEPHTPPEIHIPEAESPNRSTPLRPPASLFFQHALHLEEVSTAPKKSLPEHSSLASSLEHYAVAPSPSLLAKQIPQDPVIRFRPSFRRSLNPSAQSLLHPPLPPAVPTGLPRATFEPLRRRHARPSNNPTVLPILAPARIRPVPALPGKAQTQAPILSLPPIAHHCDGARDCPVTYRARSPSHELQTERSPDQGRRCCSRNPVADSRSLRVPANQPHPAMAPISST